MVNEEALRSQLKRGRSTVVNDPNAPDVQPDEELGQSDFEIEKLPLTPYPSPLVGRNYPLGGLSKVIYNSLMPEGSDPADHTPLLMQSAGPHRELHFDPSNVVVGIVSCGGLCPGLNDVIRAVTLFSLEVSATLCTRSGPLQPPQP